MSKQEKIINLNVILEKQVSRRGFLTGSLLTLAGLSVACTVEELLPQAPSNTPENSIDPTPDNVPEIPEVTPTLEVELESEPLYLIDNELLQEYVKKQDVLGIKFQTAIEQMIHTNPDWQDAQMSQFDVSMLVLSGKSEGKPDEGFYFASYEGQTWVLGSYVEDMAGTIIVQPLISKKTEQGIQMGFGNVVLFESAIEADKDGVRAYRRDGTSVFSDQSRLTEQTLIGSKVEAALVPVVVDQELGIVTVEYKDKLISGFNQDGGLVATYDFSTREWIEAETYDTTEYEGVFSEKYAPSFSESFLYKDEQSGIEFPINIGLSPEFPVKSFKLTDLGKEWLGEKWMKAAYFRYSQTMGNKDVTYEQYLNLLNNGQGKLDYLFIDEITNEAKSTKIDPRNGVSVLITSREDLPMDALPANYANQTTSYLTMNNQGQPIISVANTLKSLDSEYNAIVTESKTWSAQFYFAETIVGTIRGDFNYFALLTKDNFYRGGQMTNRPSGVLNEDEKAIIDIYNSIDKKTEPHPFVEDVKYIYN